MLKIRIPNEEQSLELPKIEADENIRAEDRLQALPKGKEGTLSAAYPDHRKDYRWTPGWSLAGTGHLRIADAAAVPDGSLIAFLESVRTGVKNRSNIERVLESAKLLDALYASAAKRRELEVR